MTAVDLAVTRLKVEEGFRGTAYRDSKGRLTIGYGFCVDAGLSEPAAAALLGAQVQERELALQAYPWYVQCDPVRQSVLLDLSFNDGVQGLLHFVHMLGAITQGDWPRARAELLDSEAAREAPHRYQFLASLLLKGEP